MFGKGFVYCISNEVIENMYLIGYASYDVDIQEIFDYLPVPYKIYDLINDVSFPKQTMDIINDEVIEQRINPKYGYFRSNRTRITDAFMIIRKMIRHETFQETTLDDNCVDRILLR